MPQHFKTRSAAASIRKALVAVALIAVLSVVTSCSYSPSGAAKDIALQGIAEQLDTLQSRTQTVVDSNSTTDAVQSIKEGNAGSVEPSPFTSPSPNSPLDAAFDYAFFGARSAAHDRVHVEAALWSQGESGGGFTGDQVWVYLCVSLDFRKSASATKPVVHSISCPPKLAAILKGQNRDLVRLSDIPSRDS
jgi:hypothetical protein